MNEQMLIAFAGLFFGLLGLFHLRAESKRKWYGATMLSISFLFMFGGFAFVFQSEFFFGAYLIMKIGSFLLMIVAFAKGQIIKFR